MPSITDFLAEVRSTGFARTEKFQAIITPNPKMGIPLPPNNLLTLFCEEAAFPGKIIITRPARIHNLNIQRPSAVDFMGEAANFTFFVDSEWKVKQFFDTWMNTIIGTTREVSPYTDIVGDVTIEAIHEGPIGQPTMVDPKDEYSETPRYRVKLVEAFPKTMNLMQTSYATVGVHRVNIGFAYKFWTVEKI